MTNQSPEKLIEKGLSWIGEYPNMKRVVNSEDLGIFVKLQEKVEKGRRLPARSVKKLLLTVKRIEIGATRLNV